MNRRALLRCVGLALCLLPRTAGAFKEAGHRSIEAAAYEAILESSEFTCPGADITSDPATLAPPGVKCADWKGAEKPFDACRCIRDKDVVPTLIQYGVLNAPDRPFPTRSEGFDPEFEHFTVDGLVVQSHIPDHLFDRQLEADRQCFHFNARGGHMTLTQHEEWGIPEGLVSDAYLECVGLVDGLFRGVLYDPRQSSKDDAGMYVLMHAIEDSFADSHVARDDKFNILYVKPWNLRTWPRYFFGNTHGRVTRSHFSEEHHMGSDNRDYGYLLGRYDENFPTVDSSAAEKVKYQQATHECLEDANKRLRRYKEDHAGALSVLTLEDLEGEVILPRSCLSRRGKVAADAIADLLRLAAYDIMRVRQSPTWGTRTVPALTKTWRNYRKKYLNHRIAALTDTMTYTAPGSEVAGKVALDRVRGDFIYPSEDLKPRKFRTAGAGLTTELRSGTPLWMGIDVFQSRNTVSHNRTVLLLDSLGWGVQVRLPIENEIGERPVGVAFDVGPGLPLPLSELISLEELQIYVGARLRVAYTAESIFESETRHSLAFGFGGATLDFIVGSQVWFGLDAPRIMYSYDFWDPRSQPTQLIWSFSGGIASDAF